MDFKRGHYRGIPVYVRELDKWGEGLELIGRNKFYDILLDIMLFIDNEIIMVEYFPVWVEVDEDDK